MANQTAVQESAQALFCAIADYLGQSETKIAFDLTNFPTYKDLYTKYKKPKYNPTKEIGLLIKESFDKHVHAPGVTLDSIKDLFENDNDWYKSSVNIAKQIMIEIQNIDSNFNKIKKVNWSDVFYVRGDKEIMGNIAILFKKANESQKKLPAKGSITFGDINKWSPADIYFASDRARKKLSEEAKSNVPLTFIELNSDISNLIDTGDLLPLSLKKQPNTVTIKKVNFERKKELDELASYSYVSSIKRERYLIVKISKTDTKSELLFQHDPSANAYKCTIILSKNARGGSASGNLIPNIIKIIDNGFGAQFSNDLKKSLANFSTEKAKVIRSIGKSDRDRYDEAMTKLSKTLVTDVLNEKMFNYLNRSKHASSIIRLLLEYTASTTLLSSKFVLAK